MSTLDLSLVLLNVVFWFGSVLLYFRTPIFEWLDNRVRHEPVTDRLRAALKAMRR